MNAALAEHTAAEPPTILIADDHALVREGIKLLLLDMFDRIAVREVADGDALLAAARRHARIDLALVDLQMPGMRGGLRLAELAERHPRIPLIVVSPIVAPDVVRRILSIPSVHAFVPKTAASSVVRAAIQAAMQGSKTPYVHERGELTQLALTPRQEEIRALLRQGLRNKTIAQMLGISEGTVKNHVSEILRALKATNRTQAAQLGHDPE